MAGRAAETMEPAILAKGWRPRRSGLWGQAADTSRKGLRPQLGAVGTPAEAETRTPLPGSWGAGGGRAMSVAKAWGAPRTPIV